MSKVPSLALAALFSSAALFASHSGSHGGSHSGGSHHGGGHHSGGGNHGGGHHGGGHHGGGRSHGGWHHHSWHHWGWSHSSYGYGWGGYPYWGGWWLPCEYDDGCGLLYDSDSEDWTMVEAEGSASVVLSLDPPDSVIYLEDHFLGPGPKVVSAEDGVPLAPGKHTITASRPGYQDKTVEVELSPGESRQVELSLEKAGS